MNITDTIITKNAKAKVALFDMLPKDMANDVWFYVHLGNYGQTACKVTDEYRPLDGELSQQHKYQKFTLRFERGLGMNGSIPLFSKLFELRYDSRYDGWQQLIAQLKENARAILGLESPDPYKYD